MKQLSKPKTFFRISLIALVSGLFIALLVIYNSGNKLTDLNQWGNEKVAYEKAKVINVQSQSLKQDSNTGMETGTQQIQVRILTGSHKGQTQNIKNYLSDYTNIIGKAGETLVVRITTATDGTCNYSVYDYNRSTSIYVIVIVFLLALILIGGKKGLMAVLGLFFSFICIIFIYIPMIIHGDNPIISSLIISVLVTAVTMLLIGGFTSKTTTAFLGTSVGLVTGTLTGMLAGSFAHISGYTTGDAESLILLAGRAHIQVGALIFGGITISSLGAVIDIAMSISSSVYEVYQSRSDAENDALFHSGMSVGRDMMGTMANTLILAFTGSTLSTLLLIYTNKVPYGQLVNSAWLGLTVIQEMSGSLAVIFTVPVTALIASRIMPAFTVRGVSLPKNIKSEKSYGNRPNIKE